MLLARVVLSKTFKGSFTLASAVCWFRTGWFACCRKIEIFLSLWWRSLLQNLQQTTLASVNGPLRLEVKDLAWIQICLFWFYIWNKNIKSLVWPIKIPLFASSLRLDSFVLDSPPISPDFLKQSDRLFLKIMGQSFSSGSKPVWPDLAKFCNFG